MNGRAVLIGAVLLVLPGCLSHTMPLAYPNASISDAKQGRDCTVFIFGLGGPSPDVTLARAIHLGGITKLRSAEYRTNTFQGVGKECVVAHGE
ncbi:MAG: hypothetical protein KAY09_04330 [Nitrospira sp.]|nr:hypothetical protein [Nitrospira sp.]